MAGSDDRFEDDLRSLIDRGRTDEAIAQRRRRAELNRQSAESGTFLGSVLDLAERGATVAIVSGTGHRSRGRIRSIGADFIGLRDDRGRTLLVCSSAAVVLHVEPGAARTVGDRVPRGSATLMEVLSADVGRPVAVRTVWDESIAGTLHAVGSDVLVIRTDTGRSVYVSRAGITEVTTA